MDPHVEQSIVTDIKVDLVWPRPSTISLILTTYHRGLEFRVSERNLFSFSVISKFQNKIMVEMFSVFQCAVLLNFYFKICISFDSDRSSLKNRISRSRNVINWK